MSDPTRDALQPNPIPAPRPKLQVGQVWRSGDGIEVTITERDNDPAYPFEGSNGLSYTPLGKYWAGETPDKSDLVELIADVPPTEWDDVMHAAAQCDPLACCLIELRDRLATLEARLPWVGTAADVAPQVVSATTADGLSPVEPAPQAPQGVTVGELACILSEAPTVLGLGHRWLVDWLLKHPRLGPLLRGEGAPAPVPVVLPEEPSYPDWAQHGCFLHYRQGWADCHAAARAEVARQQEGQADG